MAHLKPLSPNDVPELEPLLARYQQAFGFTPNSALTMAHWPEMLRGFDELRRSVFETGKVSVELKSLVGTMASLAAGCRYCQAHGVGVAAGWGISPAKLEGLWSFQQSELFSDAERAALRFAQAAGVVPTAVTGDEFDDVRQWYDDSEIAELIGVIATMAFLNRWNDTVATELEEEPLRATEEILGAAVWQPGKHIAGSGPEM